MEKREGGLERRKQYEHSKARFGNYYVTCCNVTRGHTTAGIFACSMHIFRLHHVITSESGHFGSLVDKGGL